MAFRGHLWHNVRLGPWLALDCFDGGELQLYDALLDDLDDDATTRVDEVIDDLADDRVAGFDDVEDDLIRDVPELTAEFDELDLDVNVDGLLEDVEVDDTWSDDPVRMYLTQNLRNF